MYLNKKVCITGKLVLYNDKPQIVVNEPKQIVLLIKAQARSLR